VGTDNKEVRVTQGIPEVLLSSPARKAWKHFFALSGIPRPPRGEDRVREHVEGIAQAAGWENSKDGVGNLVVRVPGRGILRGAEPLILQGHMDMVCEKDAGVLHDFTRDPLRLVLEGGWLRASGTTLGADNGIGMALALAAAEADLPARVPLELLFTVDEESGLTGAMKLDAGMLRGRRLVNLDSEKEGVFIVSCAGGRAVTARFPREAAETSSPATTVRCRISGLRGGHSGVDIDNGRVNALATAAVVLEKLRGSDGDVRLLSLDGGTQFNVIPRDAEFVVTGIEAEELQGIAASVVGDLKAVEPLANVTVTPIEQVTSAPLPWGAVDFVNGLPEGVIAMDDGMPGLVHTSSNLGVARSDKKGAALLIKVRSAEDRRRDAECEQIAALARHCGGDSEMGDGYPGWASSSSSELVHCLNDTYSDLFGRHAEIKGIHAGLEAGVVGAMIGSGELVSLGPTIENAHSPGERLHIESVGPVLRLLEAFIGSPRCHAS
jgi:dipeptidase D